MSAVAGLKTTEAQAEDQRKLLYTTELNLATEKMTVLSLKAELQTVKEATKVAREAAKAAEKEAYERGVEEIDKVGRGGDGGMQGLLCRDVL